MSRFSFDLGSIAASSTETSEKVKPHSAKVPIGELAVKGAERSASQRQTIHFVDPKRCRPWKHHNRHASWYTRERCSDLIESLSKGDQLEPALARKVEGEADYDYELIYGMRRRFACEVLGKPLKVVVTSLNDKLASVVMHQENFNRKDISAMERAISFTSQLREGVFGSVEELAQELGLSRPTVIQMVSAAEFIAIPQLARLLPDPTIVPVKPTYKLAVLAGDEAVKSVILKAAENLASRDQHLGMSPTKILAYLADAPARSSRVSKRPLKKDYNVGATGKMIVTRSKKGEVTLKFPKGLDAAQEAELFAALRKVLADL